VRSAAEEDSYEAELLRFHKKQQSKRMEQLSQQKRSKARFAMEDYAG